MVVGMTNERPLDELRSGLGLGVVISLTWKAKTRNTLVSYCTEPSVERSANDGAIMERGRWPNAEGMTSEI